MMAEMEPVAVRVQYPVFDETVPVWANQMTVSFLGGEFVISFYAALPPMFTGTEEERHALLTSVKTVPAKCVAKIVVPRDRMPDMLNALADNVKRAESAGKIGSSAEEETDG
jgi:hypothetical protein